MIILNSPEVIFKNLKAVSPFSNECFLRCVNNIWGDEYIFFVIEGWDWGYVIYRKEIWQFIKKNHHREGVVNENSLTHVRLEFYVNDIPNFFSQRGTD